MKTKSLPILLLLKLINIKGGMFHPSVSLKSSRRSKIFPSTSVDPKNINSINQSLEKTPRKRPIFSQEKHQSTARKSNHHGASPERNKAEQNKRELASFCSSLVAKVENKSQMVKNGWAENKLLLARNQTLVQEKCKVDKKLALHGDIEELRKKNSQYRAQLLKAQGLLYELKTNSKVSTQQIQWLISSLKF